MMLKKVAYLLLLTTITLLSACKNTEVNIFIVQFKQDVKEVLKNNQFSLIDSDNKPQLNSEIAKLNKVLQEDVVIKVANHIQGGSVTEPNLKKYYSITTVKLTPTQQMIVIDKLQQLSFINQAYIAPVGEDATTNPLPQ